MIKLPKMEGRLTGVELEAALLKNGYRVGEKLGSGSFATVRKALNTGSGSEMAIKIVDHNLATKEFLEKFLSRELSIIRNLKHPNIIQLEKIMRFGPYTCVVMEQAQRGDLLEYILSKGHLPEAEAKRIFYGIVKGLQYCHVNNVAHRDLKCENILLDEHFQAKLSDFGFARIVMDPLSKKRVLSKTYCGSAAYVAPEVLRGVPYNPMLSDAWSLGVIFFISVTGLMPFDDSNLPKMLRVQTKKTWSFPKRDRPSTQCQRIISGMLEPDITLRYTVNQLLAHEWLRD